MPGHHVRLACALLACVQFGFDFGLLPTNGSLSGASAAICQDQPDTAQPQTSKYSQTNPLPGSETLPVLDELLYSCDFDSDLDEWEFSDATAWKLDQISGSQQPMIRQFVKASNYKPKHRSPLHQAILKDHQFGSFELTVDVRSTHEPYGHRDACLFFGYQNPNQFYYIHLGQATDAHCNQIFIVNNADRTKITLTTNEGTPWDENWHQVRIVRDIESGTIEVYFDDPSKPVMTAVDKTFAHGRIGIGSFDDTADWAKLRVGKLEPTASVEAPQARSTPADDGQ